MYTHFNGKLGSQIATIHPGEYYATKDDLIIATVLGSCVAVALYDTRNQIGGLNHFMLPNSLNPTAYFYLTESGKYGMYAMELLINSLIKLGSLKADLIAKVFGGGSVLHGEPILSRKIPESNIIFAFDFLKTEGIPVTSSDVGGNTARKVLFYPRTSRVLLKRIKGTIVTKVEKEEEKYLHRIQKEAKGNEPTLF